MIVDDFVVGLLCKWYRFGYLLLIDGYRLWICWYTVVADGFMSELGGYL